MSSALQNVGLIGEFVVGEEPWGDKMDANLRALDALTQSTAVSRTLAAPPTSPADGSVYIVAASPTGAWAGQANAIARIHGLTWEFFTPKQGWRCYVIAELMTLTFDGTNWGSPTASDPVNTLTSSGGVCTVNLLLGGLFTLTPTENITSFVFSNKPGTGKGGSVMIQLTQGATAFTVALTQFKWDGGQQGTVSSAANATDLISITSFDNFTTGHVTLSKARA